MHICTSLDQGCNNNTVKGPQMIEQFGINNTENHENLICWLSIEIVEFIFAKGCHVAS